MMVIYFMIQDNIWRVHGRQVFVVLNKKQISVFENENVNALIKSVNLDKIYKVVKILNDDVFCFDLLP